jgi:hypothetical protein
MSPTFAIFVFASLILAITPGPAVPRFTKLLGWRSYGKYLTATTFIALGAYVAFGGANRSSAARGQ